MPEFKQWPLKFLRPVRLECHLGSNGSLPHRRLQLGGRGGGGVLHLISRRLTVVWVSFRSLIKGMTPKIRMCFVLINSVLINVTFSVFRSVFFVSGFLSTDTQISNLPSCSSLRKQLSKSEAGKSCSYFP